MTRLGDFIAEKKDVITDLWAAKVVQRIGVDQQASPQLINEMPEVLKDLVESLRSDPAHWRSSSARLHARQRAGLGVDIGGLSEEFGLIGEAVLQMAAEEEVVITAEETSLMLRFLARSTAESVTEFARLATRERERQSAEHFSFVAHELRTPLQSAVIALSFLREKMPESRGTKRLANSLSRLSTLIDNSLVDARLSAEPSLKKEETSSGALAHEAVRNASELARQRGIDLEVEADDFDFEADRRLIVSALTNLIVNGVKFSNEGGRVVTRALLKEERVHFEVCDSCGGLPEGAAETMFHKFTQAGDDRSGFGLGLLIVKQAVEAHGGQVRVLDRPGEGCSMIVQLPRRRSRNTEADSTT